VFSDGCRVVNHVGKYAYGRYFFTNASEDILGIARTTFAAVGVVARQTNERNIAVSRTEEVALLDAFIGFKH
jgi:hypothetical protein